MKTLHLISQTSWEVAEFSLAKNVEVKFSYGLDIPKHTEDDLWRIPQGRLCLFLRSGARIVLQAPGAYWLDSIPKLLTGRSITTLTAAEALSIPSLPSLFWKFAEAKNDQFLGSVKTLEEVQAYLLSSETPLESVLQYSEEVAIVNEYRFFVAYGKVLTGSVYLTRDSGQEVTIYDGAVSKDSAELDRAQSFLENALKTISIPDGVVIDVAFTKEGSPLILEANPAWCSGWYDCDIDKVVETIEASNQYNAKWNYAPDALLVKRYQKQPPLRFLQS